MPPTPKPVKPVLVLLDPARPASPGTLPVTAGGASGLTGAVAVLPVPAGDGLRPLVPSSVAPIGMPEPPPIGEREAVPPNTDGSPVLPKVEPGPMPPATPLTCAAAEPSISSDTAAVFRNKNLIAIFLFGIAVRSSGRRRRDQHPSPPGATSESAAVLPMLRAVEIADA